VARSGSSPPTLAALFYDAERPPVRDGELDWYAQRLPREHGNVLELMCGSGRLLVPLLRAGYAIHGIDSSAALIEACGARVAAGGLRATLVRQEMHALNLPFRYTAAFVAAGAFQRLTDPAEARNTLARVRAHLVPPGILLLDLFVPPASSQRSPKRSARKPAGIWKTDIPPVYAERIRPTWANVSPNSLAHSGKNT